MPVFEQGFGGVENKVNKKFYERMEQHDKFEKEVLDIIRPFTTRRHLPDRFVAFQDKICALEVKTTVCVEDKAHDEYFRVHEETGIPVFIVYKDNGIIKADWITNLSWAGPFPPSENSTCGDFYYIISGERTLDEFLKSVC